MEVRNQRCMTKRFLGVLACAVGASVFFAFLGACSREEVPPPAAGHQADVRTVVIPVEGMSCSACAASVKKTLTAKDGVSKVEVNLAERTVRVRFDPDKISPDRLASAINDLGYRASPPSGRK